MTTEVETCEHRFTRVTESGGEYCPACDREIGVDGQPKPVDPDRVATFDKLELLAQFGRGKSGNRHAFISGKGIKGQWPGNWATLSGYQWQPGEIAVMWTHEGCWRAAFGDYESSYRDDSILARDIVTAARYLAGKNIANAPDLGAMLEIADTLGLRLDRAAYQPGHFVSHSRFETLAEWLAFQMRPKGPGPKNLRRG